MSSTTPASAAWCLCARYGHEKQLIKESSELDYPGLRGLVPVCAIRTREAVD